MSWQMSLLKLPVELVYMIGDFLSFPDCLTFYSLCKDLHFIRPEIVGRIIACQEWRNIPPLIEEVIEKDSCYEFLYARKIFLYANTHFPGEWTKISDSSEWYAYLVELFYESSIALHPVTLRLLFYINSKQENFLIALIKIMIDFPGEYDMFYSFHFLEGRLSPSSFLANSPYVAHFHKDKSEYSHIGKFVRWLTGDDYSADTLFLEICNGAELPLFLPGYVKKYRKLITPERALLISLRCYIAGKCDIEGLEELLKMNYSHN